MDTKHHIMGLFTDEALAAETIAALRASTFKLLRVHGPIPGHKVSDALKQKKSPVGYFTLIGGILGFFAGFALAVFTADQWHLIVGGKPIRALVPFFIVGFEFTILFSVIGNVIGMMTQARLPRFKLPGTYDPRCSGEHFGILATCTAGEQEELIDFFKQKGGEIRIFD
jgi:ActD protein